MSETDSMEAGPEVNALVAVEVMGWSHDYHLSQTHAEDWRLDGKRVAGPNWSPSTDWSAAGEVLGRFTSYTLQTMPHVDRVLCIVWIDPCNHGMAYAATAPLAICRAALAAVRSKDTKEPAKCQHPNG